MVSASVTFLLFSFFGTWVFVRVYDCAFSRPRGVINGGPLQDSVLAVPRAVIPPLIRAALVSVY